MFKRECKKMNENPDEYVDRMKFCEHQWIEYVSSKTAWCLVLSQRCAYCKKINTDYAETYGLISKKGDDHGDTYGI
jgi:hypothetical protein